MLSFFNKKNSGVVSVFLIAILLPLMTMGTTLSELGHLRSGEQVLNEAVDSASTSVLSMYDKFLMKRFGLMAIAQDKSCSDKKFKKAYCEYMKKNLGGAREGDELSQIMTMSDVDVERLYSLSDNKVLKEQMLEFSKLRAPTFVALEALDKVVKALKKKFKQISSYLNIISSGCDGVKSILDVMNALEDLCSAQSAAHKAYNTYNAADYPSKVKKLEEELESLITEYNKQKKQIQNKPVEKRVNLETGYRDESRKIIKIIIDNETGYEELIKYLRKNSGKEEKITDFSKMDASDQKLIQQAGLFREAVQKERELGNLPNSWEDYIKDKDNKKEWCKYWKESDEKHKKFTEENKEYNKAMSEISGTADDIVKKTEEIQTRLNEWKEAAQYVITKVKAFETASMKTRDMTETAVTSVANAVSKINSESLSLDNQKADEKSDEEKETINKNDSEAEQERKKEKNEDIEKKKRDNDAKLDAAQNDGKVIAEGLDAAKGKMKKIVDEIEKIDFAAMRSSFKRIITCVDSLSEQNTQIKNNFQTSSVAGYLNKFKKVLGEGNLTANEQFACLHVLFRNPLGSVIMGFIEVVLDSVAKFVDQMAVIFETLKALSNGEIMTCSNFNIRIDDDTWESLKNVSVKTSSENDAKDKIAVNKKLDDVEKSLGVSQEKNRPEPMAELNEVEGIIQAVFSDMAGIADGISVFSGTKSSDWKESLKDTVTDWIPGVKAIKKVKKLISLAEHVKNLTKHLNQGIVVIEKGIVNYIYNGILLNTYITNMFSNRTSGFAKQETLSGELMEKVVMHGSVKKEEMVDPKKKKDLSEIFESCFDVSKLGVLAQEDDCFARSEVEYIIAGNQKESANQNYVAGTIYLFRMLLNIPAALQNDLIKGIPVPLYVIAVVIVDAAEALLDLFILTSGVEVEIIKTKDSAFLEPQNISKLIDKLLEVVEKRWDYGKMAVSIVKAAGEKGTVNQIEDEYKEKAKQKEKEREEQREKEKAEQNDKGKETDPDADHDAPLDKKKNIIQKGVDKLLSFKMDYTDYLLLILTVKDEDTKIDRVQDLIQMEARKKHQGTSLGTSFTLGKAYTAVRCEVDGNWNALLPIPNSVLGYDIGTLSRSRTYYCSY